MEKENWIDAMVRRTWERVNNSKLKPIMDNLGLKRGSKGFSIGGDLGYTSLKLYDHGVEIRSYDNGKVFVHFGYDNNAGAWGGYTRKCEVTETDVFKKSNWLSIIKKGGVKTNPDVIMI